MEPANDIQKIRERLFDDSFFDHIFALYQKECHEEGSGVSEKEFCWKQRKTWRQTENGGTCRS